MRFTLPTLFFIIGTSANIQAQLTIQQPVVGSTSVSTSVSVPDRGSTFLGGVNSAQSARSSYGPLRTGTNRGSTLSSTSISASVTIIDLHEMDEAILNSVADSSAPVAIRTLAINVPEGITKKDESGVAEKIAKFEKLAQQAESAGKSGLAKLHWQMAAKHGSTLALARLNVVSTPVAQAAIKK